MKKTIALLFLCFVGIKSLNGMQGNPSLQSNLKTLKTSLVTLKSKLGDLNNKLGGLKAKIVGKGTGYEQALGIEKEKPAPEIVAKREDYGTKPRNEFFTNIMGVDEKSGETNMFMTNSDQIIKGLEVGPDPSKTKLFKINGVDGKGKHVVYQCGFFEKIKLGDLQKKASTEQTKDFGPIIFNVIEADKNVFWEDDNGKSSDGVDIGALQADPENKNAVFQVASNFNALETLGHTDKIPNITKYVGDKTQGPSASISAAPGLIYRHYYYFYDGKKENALNWQQKPQHNPTVSNFQINLLKDLGIKTMNGYIWGDGNEPDRSKDSGIKSIVGTNANKFCIGYHSEVQVTFGGKRKKDEKGAQLDCQEFFYDPSQIIDQIFTAALVAPETIFQRSDLLEGATNDKVQLILNWIYEATLKAAFVKGKRNSSGKIKVFLTRMGGGAFGNPQNFIDNAIINAIQDPVLKQSGLIVTLNNYYSLDNNEAKDLLVHVNGQYIRYKADGAYKLTLDGDTVIETKIAK
ncbi:MAG: hypothetical protein V1646_04320 [bacterium]